MKRVASKLTYANVMVTILAFVVLAGGTAFAAGQLGKNSVGPKQLKKNAVTAAKIKNTPSPPQRSRAGRLPARNTTAASPRHVPSGQHRRRPRQREHGQRADDQPRSSAKIPSAGSATIAPSDPSTLEPNVRQSVVTSNPSNASPEVSMSILSGGSIGPPEGLEFRPGKSGPATPSNSTKAKVSTITAASPLFHRSPGPMARTFSRRGRYSTTLKTFSTEGSLRFLTGTSPD